MLIWSFVLSLLALGGTSGVFWWISGRSQGPDTAPTPPYDDRAVLAALETHDGRFTGLQTALQGLADSIGDQNLAIAEGIERTDRAERRVRATIVRARSRMASAGYHDEGLEAEAEDIRPPDDSERVAEPVHPVPEGVAPVDLGKIFPGEW